MPHNNSAPPFMSSMPNGNVVGPASATNNYIAVFNGITGKLIKVSAIAVNDNGSLIGVTPNSGDLTAAVVLSQVPVIFKVSVSGIADPATYDLIPATPGLRFIPESAWMKLDAITGALVTPIIASIGTAAGSYIDAFAALTGTGLATVQNILGLTIASTRKSLDVGGAAIKVNVSQKALGIGLSNYNLTFYIRGYFEAGGTP